MRNGNRSSYFSGLFSFSYREHFVAFVNDRGKTLKVEVRDQCSDEEWRGSFSPHYIEELTKKTGNFKRFSVFLTMLHSVLCQRTKSLSIDFVSYDDLENFQKLRLKRNSLGFSTGKENPVNRRYLILTYISDFDRTFYPLPLTYFGVVDKEALFKKIHRLRDACFNKCNYKGIVGSCSSSFDDGEYKNRIAVLESERDNALAELNRLRSILHILHGKDNHELGNVSSARNCSSHSANRPNISPKIMSSSMGYPLNRRSSSISTSSHNSGGRLHQSVVAGPASRVGSMTNNSERSLLRGGRSCGSSHSLSTSRSHQCYQQPRMSSNSPRKLSRSCSLYSSRCRRFDPTAYVHEQRRKQQEVKQKRKLEEISRLSHQSASPAFRIQSRFPAAHCDVTLDTHTLQQRRLLLLKQYLNKSATVVASCGWDRLTSAESDFHGLSDYNPQHACRSREKRIPLPSNDTHLNRELNDLNRRLDNLQGYLSNYFSHLPV
ncbi:Coiled-coil domain-containing protein [Echinococcus granulosus]|uniref:Coiled-coil domain-containing protein n=1 Tax=Echinococcus granulosus TaxID=6210 RepID=W6UQ12_ECHGR|nr:Coiled-coil domain-containing protein [Echinococcus granulosus]EUB55449.1 Coiled-coil domain-containing protein [Echinococcus granulosus]